MKIKLNKDGLTGDQLKTVEELEKRFADLPDSVTKDEVTAQLREAGLIGEDGKPTVDLKKLLGEGEGSLRHALKQQGIEIEALKAGGLEKPKDMSLRGQIKAWQERADVKEAVNLIKSGSQATVPAFDLDLRAAYGGSQQRAAATMTFATVNAGGSAFIPTPYIDPNVVDLVRIQPTFFDYLIKGRTNRAQYVWVNKVNKQGNAAFIGEGVLKPLASFDLETEISNAKKVAERMKASTEILEDIEGFATMIENELRYEVMMAVNTALLTGTLSSTVPAGITTFASAYTLTGIEVSNPNNFDAIRAAVAQLRNLNFFGNVVAFMNPVDAANMELSKAVDSGVYMLPPFTSSDGTRISGVRVVEDNNIPVGNLLVVDLTKFKVLIYKDFSISWGWENDDFSKNLVTVIGEMRLHSFHSDNHTGAFLYDSFADIKAAIDSAGS